MSNRKALEVVQGILDKMTGGSFRGMPAVQTEETEALQQVLGLARDEAFNAAYKKASNQTSTYYGVGQGGG